MSDNGGYNGNPHLPKSGSQYSYTKEQAKEIKKCMADPVYFAETYFKIISVDDGLVPFKLYDFQKEAASSYLDERKMILATSRQIGKTSIATVIVLHYALFNSFKKVFILANKADTALEILSRIQLAYEHLPNWLKAGVIEWNKGTVEFDNGTRIAARATSSDNIRGQSCVTDNTMVCVEVDECVHYTNIKNVLNKRTFIDIHGVTPMQYSIYEITNLKNNKKYIGFHTIHDKEEILCEESDYGSIYKSGYLGSGKLIISAVEKYGPDNFSQKLLYVTNDKEEAEAYERELVNSEWVESEDTYNISLGGNVCILYGENNGFYGKRHSKETLAKIQEARQKALSENPFSWCEMYLAKDADTKFFTYEEVYDYFKIEGNDREKRHELCRLVHSGELVITSKYLYDILIKHFHEREEMIRNRPETLRKVSEAASKRFKGVKKSPESNIKRGKSISKWIKENPDAHKERMDKINKNPEKIRKMAETHRGMKRSAEARANMSKAQMGKTPKLKYWNDELKELKSFTRGEQPAGWVLSPKKLFINKKTGKKKYFHYLYVDIPSDWETK